MRMMDATERIRSTTFLSERKSRAGKMTATAASESPPMGGSQSASRESVTMRMGTSCRTCTAEPSKMISNDNAGTPCFLVSLSWMCSAWLVQQERSARAKFSVFTQNDAVVLRLALHCILQEEGALIHVR